jgi:hypothetical protein
VPRSTILPYRNHGLLFYWVHVNCHLCILYDSCLADFQCRIAGQAQNMPTLIGAQVFLGLSGPSAAAFQMFLGELVPVSHRGYWNALALGCATPMQMFGPIVGKSSLSLCTVETSRYSLCSRGAVRCACFMALGLSHECDFCFLFGHPAFSLLQPSLIQSTPYSTHQEGVSPQIRLHWARTIHPRPSLICPWDQLGRWLFPLGLCWNTCARHSGRPPSPWFFRVG